MDRIHTEPEDDIAVVCILLISLIYVSDNVRIPRPISRPFTAMTGNRESYLCAYMEISHTIQGNHFDRLLALSRVRGEWPAISNIEQQGISVRIGFRIEVLPAYFLPGFHRMRSSSIVTKLGMWNSLTYGLCSNGN